MSALRGVVSSRRWRRVPLDLPGLRRHSSSAACRANRRERSGWDAPPPSPGLRGVEPQSKVTPARALDHGNRGAHRHFGALGRSLDGLGRLGRVARGRGFRSCCGCTRRRGSNVFQDSGARRSGGGSRHRRAGRDPSHVPARGLDAPSRGGAHRRRARRARSVHTRRAPRADRCGRRQPSSRTCDDRRARRDGRPRRRCLRRRDSGHALSCAARVSDVGPRFAANVASFDLE